MPGAFTRAFADRLDQFVRFAGREAGSALAIEAGKIYIGRVGRTWCWPNAPAG